MAPFQGVVEFEAFVAANTVFRSTTTVQTVWRASNVALGVCTLDLGISSSPGVWQAGLAVLASKVESVAIHACIALVWNVATDSAAWLTRGAAVGVGQAVDSIGSAAVADWTQ